MKSDLSFIAVQALILTKVKTQSLQLDKKIKRLKDKAKNMQELDK